MPQGIELNGLKRFGNGIKNKLKPACQHTNISSLISFSGCLGNGDIECCRNDNEIQTGYVCKDCGQIKFTTATVCSECCNSIDEEKGKSCLNQGVDPTILLSGSVIHSDPLYTAQYPYSTLDAKNFADYVVEKGTINGGTYYKGNSGLLELWIQRYSSSSSFSSGVNSKAFAIRLDSDTLPFLSPLNCIATSGISGRASSSMGYCRISHSSSMSPAPSTAGYYLDCGIGCSTAGTYSYGTKAYCTARGK